MCHVCGFALSGAILVHNLYRIENVGTRPAQRITSNDEERKRQGFELQTTFSFEGSGSMSRQIVRDAEGEIATLDFAQAARISRINKGLRRRKDKEKVGFFINPKSGAWIGEKKEEDDDSRPDTLRQLIVPMVEDRKNAFLLRFPGRWLAQLGPERRRTLTSIQHALARGIESVFQLEEAEILVEPAPSSDERSALLFYESAEGGAGALAQLVSWNDGFMQVAGRALEIMHYDPASFGEAKEDPGRLSETGEPECVAGCYRCVLSYFNQPDHEQINRRDTAALSFLLRLVHAGPSDTDGMPASGTADRMPPDEKPLMVDGVAFPNIWRKARLVVVEEGEANEIIIGKLASKGVKVLERPRDPGRRTAFVEELAELVKDRSWALWSGFHRVNLSGPVDGSGSS